MIARRMFGDVSAGKPPDQHRPKGRILYKVRFSR
jgi:hypothetical protein